MKDLDWIKNDLIAHRGFHSLDKTVPENSLLAIRKAVENGYAIEFDINVLKDGTVVVFHDKDLERMCNDPRNLIDLSYDDIRNHCLLATDEKIPTLKEALSLVQGKVPLLIELKHHGDKVLLCEKFMEIMSGYKGIWAIHSFHPMILMWFKKNHPQVIKGQISEFFLNETDMSKLTKYLLRSMKLNILTKPDFINYGIRDMPNKYIDRAMKKGLVVIGYAAKTQAELDFVRSLYNNAVFEFFTPKKH